MIRNITVSVLTAAALALAAGAPVTSAAYAQTLNVGSGTTDFSSLDPHRATQTGDIALVSWMFNGLVRFPPGTADITKIEADLATDWESSPDGLIWTFHLREGVQFHGGFGELTADDVVYSLTRAMNADTSSFSSDYASFQTVEAVDDRTVRIVLLDPVPALLGVLANYHGGMIVSKKAAEQYGENFKANPIGTGPFMFEEAVTQQYVKLAAFPEYFRGEPQIEAINFRYVPNAASRDLAFQSGELDMAIGLAEDKWVEQARNWPNTIVDTFQPGEFSLLSINMSRPPLDDIKVRQAIAHAVSVDQLMEFKGLNITKKGCSVVPPGYLGEDCSAGEYEYDPELSKQLLAEAGHPDGITLSVVVSSAKYQNPVMEIIQAQLAEVGIDMQMNIVDHPTYHEMIRQNVSDLVFYAAGRFPIADSFLTQFFDSNSTVGTPTAVTNFSHCNVADDEIRRARTSPYPDQQLELWSAAQAKIHEAVCALPLYSLTQVWVRSKAVDYGYELEGAINLVPPITETTTLTR